MKPVKIEGVKNFYHNKEKGVKIDTTIFDLKSKVLSPVSKIYKDGSFMASTALCPDSKDGFCDHHFYLEGYGKEWIYKEDLIYPDQQESYLESYEEACSLDMYVLDEDIKRAARRYVHDEMYDVTYRDLKDWGEDFKKFMLQ